MRSPNRKKSRTTETLVRISLGDAVDVARPCGVTAVCVGTTTRMLHLSSVSSRGRRFSGALQAQNLSTFIQKDTRVESRTRRTLSRVQLHRDTTRRNFAFSDQPPTTRSSSPLFSSFVSHAICLVRDNLRFRFVALPSMRKRERERENDEGHEMYTRCTYRMMKRQRGAAGGEIL